MMTINYNFRYVCSGILALTFALTWSAMPWAESTNPPLEIKTQFFYEDENKEIKPLNNTSVLKSGQHIGVAFRAKENCFVYIFWNDTSGNVGVLFPNPRLTETIPQVVAEKTYWLPHKDGERWYVLDENPGTEIIYFVASRRRNLKLEELSKTISDPFAGTQATSGAKGFTKGQTTAPQAKEQVSPQGNAVSEGASAQPVKPESAEEIKRVLNLMGFAQHTDPKSAQKTSFSSKEEIFHNLETSIRISGAEALFKIEFKHVSN